jgi:hypothetical protein
MKNFTCSLMLSCVAAAPAIGGDAGEMLRNRLIFCNQFVIEHPDPAVITQPPFSCCRFGRRGHDCHVLDVDDRDR